MAVVCRHNLDNVFDTVLANLQLISSEIQDGETKREPAENFNLEEFWIKIGQVFRSMSKEATKLSLLFSKPPLPTVEESQSMLNSLEMNAVALISVYYSLPKHRGIALRKSTKHAVINIVDAIKLLVGKIKHDQYECSGDQLQSTGSVWEVCDMFDTIPKNNRDAVLVKMNETKELVKDAVTELLEAEKADSHGDDWQGFEDLLGPDSSNEDTWSDNDKVVLQACTGLLKVTRSCLKKVTVSVKQAGQWEDEWHIAQLDDIADIIEAISPSVDELAEVLYPPMKHEAVIVKTTQLASVLKKLLERIKSSHVCIEADLTWIAFLHNATDHNLDKINESIK